MEKKHPSLPPNYVTIADLQQRWLKQKQQEQIKNNESNQQKQENEEKEQVPTGSFNQQHQPALVRTAPKTSNRGATMYRPKIRSGSVTHSSAIQAKAKAGIGDENTHLENKTEESKTKGKKKKKKKKAKANPRAMEEKGTSEAALAEIKMESNKDDAKKTTIETEPYEKTKSDDSQKYERSNKVNEGSRPKRTNHGRRGGGFRRRNHQEQKQGLEERATSTEEGALAQVKIEESSDANETTIESESNEKKSDGSRLDEGSRRYKSQRSNHGNRGGGFRSHEQKPRGKSEGAIADVKMGDDKEAESSAVKKVAVKSESKKKSDDDSKVEEVEHKIGGLSMSSGRDKQNGMFKRVNRRSRYSQPQRSYGYSYGYGDFGGRSYNRSRNYEEQKPSVEKMIWVEKNGYVGGEIET